MAMVSVSLVSMSNDRKARSQGACGSRTQLSLREALLAGTAEPAQVGPVKPVSCPSTRTQSLIAIVG